MKLAELIPWDELARAYHKNLSATQDRPAKGSRLVIGAVIIKHKLCLSDEETVQQIQENPYLQYFVGLPRYQTESPFAPSLFVEIRKRMGQSVFEIFHEAIIGAITQQKPAKKPGKQQHQGPPDPQDSSPGDGATRRRRLNRRMPPVGLRKPSSCPSELRQTHPGRHCGRPDESLSGGLELAQ